jgi:hypothetical protein
MTDETPEMIELLRAGVVPESGATLEGQAMIDGLESMLRENAHPHFETVMVDVQGREATYPGVEVEHPSATIWSVREGQISSAEFHLDRRFAMRSVGLED